MTAYCMNCNVEIEDVFEYCSIDCLRQSEVEGNSKYDILLKSLSSRTLGFINHAGVFPVFDIKTNEIIDILSSVEEVWNDYPTATWYDSI